MISVNFRKISLDKRAAACYDKYNLKPYGD